MMRVHRLPLGVAVLGLLLSVPLLLQGTTVIQPTFDQLVGSSDYIVRGVVRSVDSAWRENARKPGERYIGSKVTIEVHEVIKGTPPSPLVLDMVGGRVGDAQLVVEGAPKFVVGQESILFVSGNGTNFFPLTGIMHGFFPIRHDERAGRDQVMRFDGRLLYSERELDPSAATLPVTRQPADRPLTPQAFRDRIQARQGEINSRVQPH